MRLGCVGLTTASRLVIPLPAAGLWRQEREEAGIPGARRGRREERGREPERGSETAGVAGGGDEIVRGWHYQVTNSAVPDSGKLVTFSGCVTLSVWLARFAPQFPHL